LLHFGLGLHRWKKGWRFRFFDPDDALTDLLATTRLAAGVWPDQFDHFLDKV
jgi:hypothetical protein